MKRIPIEVLAEAGGAFGALDEVDGDRLVVSARSVGTDPALSAR